MYTLIIRHIASSDPPKFVVERLGDGKAGPETAVPPPDSVPVEGRPNDTLSGQLRWYLEEFLSYPFPPELDHAERVQKAFRTWGRQAFDVLFTPAAARRAYEKAVDKGFEHLTIRIVSDDPTILGWPWEALEDPEAFRLATQCQIERRLNVVRDAPEARARPDGQVNVLLVIARPYEGDVKYRSIARPLVEMAAKTDLPVSVDVLRPPTFDQLRAHLKARPNHYHILHFDGHGGYGPIDSAVSASTGATSSGPYRYDALGELEFEKADGSADSIKATMLSELLREHAVPAVVLNACQSAMVDQDAADPFASVAASLLKAGTRSVAAMAYALYVSGAQQFLPAFYTELFATGDMARAVRAGRQAMVRHPGRVCARGTYPLEDWVVPVLYQQEAPEFGFTRKAATPAERKSRLPDEARDDRNPYGFIGRDGPLLELERAMHREPAGILVSGLGGVGKTTLARGFLRWLDETGGLPAGAFWFSFADIRNTDYVFNRLGEAIYGKAEFATLDTSTKIELLVKACREHPFVIVWDNFESVKGMPGTAVAANLTAADANHLKDFLTRLRGGKTKVLITSRSPEDWLGATNRGRPVALRGLDGEERWELANKIVHDLGLKVDRTDPAVTELMDVLRGHPLAMRVVLTKLEKQSASQLMAGLGSIFQAVRPEAQTEEEAAVFATLRFATDALPVEWRPLLVPLSLHEGYVAAALLKAMTEQADSSIAESTIDDGLLALAHAGLLRDLGQATYEMHPLLTSYLKSAGAWDVAPPNRDRWERAFVEVMARLADSLVPKHLHEQQIPFLLHGSSFHVARDMGRRKDMHVYFSALTQAIAAYALRTLRYETASTLCAELAERCGPIGMEKEQAAAIRLLGMVAQERRDLDVAEEWYRKSLAVDERLGNERGAASSYHQLGMVAQERRDLDVAEEWYRKSLAVVERLGDEPGAAQTYHQLGMVAEDRRDLAAAEGWYRKSLMVAERLGDEYGAATIYGQLGALALLQKNLVLAEEMYQKPAQYFARVRDDTNAAIAYHQLGRVAEERSRFGAAEGWYYKSLAALERLGDERRAASTYHQLGLLAQLREDFAAAEGWYRKSLAVEQRLGNEHGSAQTYHQLGVVAEEQQKWEEAWLSFLKALAVFSRFQDKHSTGIVVRSLGRSYHASPPDVRVKLQALGREAGLPDEFLQELDTTLQNPPTGS